MPERAAIALAPDGTRSWLGEAVEAGGGTIVAAADADGLVWTDPADPAGLGQLLDAHPQLHWIQLPWAGIEPYVDVVRAHAERIWTCGKGVYAEPVAEHALALALALTPATSGLLDRRRLELLDPDGWVVNVARGGHIVTDDLVAVLAGGRIGGAALDVTDPEPLPDGHPLWDEPRCIITPHTGNTFEMAIPLLAERVRENVRRRLAGEPLLGPVDPEAGY